MRNIFEGLAPPPPVIILLSFLLEATSVELEEDNVPIFHHIIAASLVVLAGSLVIKTYDKEIQKLVIG